MSQSAPRVSVLPALITGTVIISVALGFSLLLWLALILALLLDLAQRPSAYPFHLALAGGVAAAAACLVLWVRSRGRLERMSSIRRWLLVAACTLLPLLYLAAVGLLLFGF